MFLLLYTIEFRDLLKSTMRKLTLSFVSLSNHRNLSYNLFEELPKDLFKDLVKLGSLSLAGAEINNIHVHHFSTLHSLKHV